MYKAKSLIVILGIVALIYFPVSAQQKRVTSTSKQAPFNQQQFDEAVKQANQTREAGNVEEAIELYKKAITLKPKWNEGWWYLATLLYEKDQYAEAAKAFNNAAALNPKVGAPIAMLALCEFQLSEYDKALSHLIQGRKLGIGDNEGLAKVIFFHEAMLLTLKGEFEQSERFLNKLSYDNVSSEQLYLAHGLAVMRMPLLPQQIGATHKDREMLRRVGYAQHVLAQLNASDGQQEYERFVADYPKISGVQYAYGRYLLYKLRLDDEAILAFQKELQNSPNHALARLQIAYIKLKNKEPEDGLKYAEEAVRLNTRMVLGHYILGRMYLEVGKAQRAVEELEISQRMSPDEAKVYFALARAYSKVGRKADADQARQNFTRLNAAAEALEANGQVRATAIEENEEKPKQ